MVENKGEILILGRQCIQGYERFVPWDCAKSLVSSGNKNFAWSPRDEAEKSEDWVQPIPCAFLRDDEGRYCVLRRIRETRADLRSRITLVVGGHVDRPLYEQSKPSLLLETLKRELDEEIGVQDLSVIEPIGLVIDSSSTSASRHIAFVYEATLQGSVVPRSKEEFATRSKFSGHFFTVDELSKFHSKFDPWSLILFESYIAPSHPKKPHQYAFSLHIPTDR